MGLLQGPRLMARTTKSPIRRNHWVPLGCRGHLGSVKMIKVTSGFNLKKSPKLKKMSVIELPLTEPR